MRKNRIKKIALAVLSTQESERYILRLYISGITPRSMAAICNVKEICEKHLSNRFHLQVIDIYQQPKMARDQKIVVAPTLIKQKPLPLRRLVGDLSNQADVLDRLGLVPLALDSIAKEQ